jgi:hypothetical protein
MDPDTPPVSTVDYPESFSRHKHEWLFDFLKSAQGNKGTPKPRRQILDFGISIIDTNSQNGPPSIHWFKSLPADFVDPDFWNALNQIPSTTKTRIICVHHRYLENIPRVYLNAVGKHFDIDPRFFEYHLTLLEQQDYTHRKGKIPTPRPLRIRFLRIIYNTFNHLTMTVSCFYDWKVGEFLQKA